MTRFGMRVLAAVAAVGLGGLTAPAQTLVEFNPGAGANAPLTATQVNSDLIAGGLGGFNISTVGVANALQGSGFADVPASTGYGFTLRSAAGGTFDLTGLTFSGFRDADGPTNFVATTNFASTTQNSSPEATSLSNTTTTIDLTGMGPQTVGPNETIFFLLNGYGSPMSAGTFDLTNTLTLTGTFTPVPEPATVLALAAGGLGLLRLRRRPG